MTEPRGIPAGIEPKLTKAISEFFARTYDGESEADVLIDIIADAILADRAELDRLREENALLVGEVSDLKYRLSYANESLSHRTEIIHNVWDALGNPTLVQNEGRTVSECVSHAVRTRDGEISRLREAIIEACDLLMERKQGSPSRSPSHNARLRLEEAIGHWNGRALSPDNPTQKKEGEA